MSDETRITVAAPGHGLQPGDVVTFASKDERPWWVRFWHWLLGRPRVLPRYRVRRVDSHTCCTITSLEEESA